MIVLYNIVKVVRLLAEALGYGVAAGASLLFFLGHEPDNIEAFALIGLPAAALTGWEVWKFVDYRKAQIKIDRANAKAKEPLPEAPEAPTNANGRPQVAPWDRTAA